MEKDAMGLPLAKQSEHTLEEWRDWEGRWELIDGVAYDMTPSPNFEHQRISSNLNVRIAVALEEACQKFGRKDCDVLAAPMDVYLGPTTVVEPDLMVVCDPAKKSERGIEGAPDLVVEILSPSTASKDMNAKWWLYEAAGVPEYLIVDPVDRRGRLLRLVDGKYEEAARVSWGETVQLLGGELSILLD